MGGNGHESFEVIGDRGGRFQNKRLGGGRAKTSLFFSIKSRLPVWLKRIPLTPDETTSPSFPPVYLKVLSLSRRDSTCGLGAQAPRPDGLPGPRSCICHHR